MSIAQTHSDVKTLDHQIRTRLKRLEELIVTNQDELNTRADRLGVVVDTINTGVVGLRGDVQALKDQIAAGTAPENLDFTAIDARLDAVDTATSGLTELDSETPAPTDPSAV